LILGVIPSCRSARARRSATDIEDQSRPVAGSSSRCSRASPAALPLRRDDVEAMPVSL
jgi:hypothetical protein